jgi:hypothetical protein
MNEPDTGKPRNHLTAVPGAVPSLLRVRVHLINSDPEIWRLVEVDGNLPLDQVHAVVQTVIGWEDSHLHLFTDTDPDAVSRRRNWSHTERRWGSEFLRDNNDSILPEEEVTLREVLTVDSPLFYEYDLGDSWIHRIDLIETLPRTPTDPVATVIRGERACPLEDSGGIHGYQELLGILADPLHPEHDDRLDWVHWIRRTRTPFDPALFDIDAVNTTLRQQFPHHPSRNW